MRNYLLAAAAAVAIATPALARDGSPYLGIEGGIVLPQDLDLDVTSTSPTVRSGNGFTVDFKRGLDADVLAGYDFGIFRVEGELGYKRLRAEQVRFDTALATDIGRVNNVFDVSDRGSVVSLMANGMADFGDNDSFSGFIGGGVGRARVKMFGDRDSAFAWQVIAGVRQAITPNVDVGLKYRYFRTGKLDFDNTFNGGTNFGLDGSGKLRTHSLLASVIYNFGAPAPAPVVVEPVIAPPPAPPATQTCYDGSVVLATDVCPQPPVAAPAPAPERG